MSEDRETSAPWSSERDKFLAMLLTSHLLGYREIVAALKDCDATSDVTELCRHLVEQGALTDWQCTKLRNCKHKGFYLEGFKILDKPSDSESRYRAVECATGRQVVLEIVPNHRFPGGIEFWEVNR